MKKMNLLTQILYVVLKLTVFHVPLHVKFGSANYLDLVSSVDLMVRVKTSALEFILSQGGKPIRQHHQKLNIETININLTHNISNSMT